MLNKDEGKGTSWQERRHQWLHDDVHHFPMTLLCPRHFPHKPSGAVKTFEAGDVMSEVKPPAQGDNPDDLQFEMADQA